MYTYRCDCITTVHTVHISYPQSDPTMAHGEHGDDCLVMVAVQNLTVLFGGTQCDKNFWWCGTICCVITIYPQIATFLWWWQPRFFTLTILSHLSAHAQKLFKASDQNATRMHLLSVSILFNSASPSDPSLARQSDYKYTAHTEGEKMAETHKKKKRTVSPELRQRISNTLREGYRTGRYSRPVGNRINHCTGPRPWVWKHGPDPLVQRQNIAMLRAKAQCKYRGEEWKLSLDDWRHLWQGKWHLRGRTTDAIMLCRRDNKKPWSRSNCYLGTRSKHFTHMMKHYTRSKTFNKN